MKKRSCKQKLNPCPLSKNLKTGQSRNIAAIVIVLLSGILAACSSIEPDSDLIEFSKIKEPTAYKINIFNASNSTINDIKFKPCSSHSTNYQQITDNLRPMEKFTINIYSQCVDLLATNAFKKKLVDVKNVDLQFVKTWTIK